MAARLSPFGPWLLVASALSLLPGCGRVSFESLGALPGSTRGGAVSGDAPPSSRPPWADGGTPTGDSDASTDAAPAVPSSDPMADPDPLDAGTDAALDAGVALPDAGAAQDAAVADAAEPDAGPVIVDPRAALPRAIRCSDYSGVLACDNLNGSRSGARVETSSFGGGAAVRDEILTATASVPESGAELVTRFMPLTSGDVYLRFSLFVPSSLPIRGINIAGLGIVGEPNDWGVDVNLINDGALEIYTSGDARIALNDTYRVPRDRWTCVHVHIEGIHGASGNVHVRMDGQPVLSSRGVDTSPPGGVTGVGAGIDWTFVGQGPATLYADNFLVTRHDPGNCP